MTDALTQRRQLRGSGAPLDQQRSQAAPDGVRVGSCRTAGRGLRNDLCIELQQGGDKLGSVWQLAHTQPVVERRHSFVLWRLGNVRPLA
jgi:hypothetical protein